MAETIVNDVVSSSSAESESESPGQSEDESPSSRSPSPRERQSPSDNTDNNGLMYFSVLTRQERRRLQRLGRKKKRPGN